MVSENSAKAHEIALGEQHNWNTIADKLLKLLRSACELPATQEEV
jgi:hypothetical protein